MFNVVEARVALVVLVALMPWAYGNAAADCENLAPAASISASGQHSEAYDPKYVADGKIPAPLCKQDTHQAWCIPHAQASSASISFEWQDPVRVAEVVYWGRTAWLDNENFTSCHVYVDDDEQPVAEVELEPGPSAQRIPLRKPVTVKRVTLRFPDNYGGPNPGASEIGIFDGHPADAQLDKIARGGAGEVLPVDEESRDRLRSGELGFTKIVVSQRHPINSSHVYTYHQEGLRPGGGLWVCDFSGADARLTQILDSSEGQVLDLNVHYDGRTILFSWKRTMTEPFQLYTVDVDGKNLKQITTDESNNFNACWLPDGGIAFLSDRKPAFAYCWKTTTPILWRCEADGSEEIRLSANYLNDFTPAVFSDGRVVYSRWEYVDRPAIPIQSLWAINPDGTRLAGVFGNRVLSPATFMDAREIPGSAGKVLCVLTSHNGPCRGAIGIVDPELGPNAQAAITNLTPEVDIGQVDKGAGNRVRGPYLNPFPLDEKYYLVSRSGSIELRDYAMEYSSVVLRGSDSLGFYAPQPVRERKREHLIASTLPDPIEDRQEWATIFMQDVYNGLGTEVERGSIERLAVVQEVEKPLGIDPDRRAFGFQFPVVSAGATYAPKRIWGYAAVEDDGSAHFKVPAREPIYFLPLDAEGRAVQRMRTFTHLMPGEVQGCVGCHPNRNTVGPPPRMAEDRPMAMRRAAQELVKPEWGVRGFSYSQIVQPVLDQHCVRCHDWEEQAGGLELTGGKTDFFNVSYEHLVRKGTRSEHHGGGGESKYTSWIQTYNGQEANILMIEPGQWGARASLLGKVIAEGHPDENGMDRVELTPDERHRVYAWMDLNCPYYRSSDSAYKANKGCRQILPDRLQDTFADVAQRRCVSCHEGMEDPFQAPGDDSFFLRLDHPEQNGFMAAPLAREAGGTQRCGNAVFADTQDPDYRKLLEAFDGTQKMLEERPRMDMRPLTDAPVRRP
ncbi:MAG: hypothetical protein GY711_10385 [bacterium]|nr:hypothetical protein [bacterium]